jgi:tetratricopeptide (TPR) repeat protein
MIEARLALGEHDPTAALAFLEEMWQFGVKQRCLFDIERRQVIAEAHRMGGRPDKAIQELRELSRIYGGNALCHYQLGKIYEEMKRPADAKKEYTTFLAMWSEADKDLPALLDARKRLAAL